MRNTLKFYDSPEIPSQDESKVHSLHSHCEAGAGGYEKNTLKSNIRCLTAR